MLGTYSVLAHRVQPGSRAAPRFSRTIDPCQRCGFSAAAMRGGRARRRGPGRLTWYILAAMLTPVASAAASPLADAATLCAAADRAPLAEKRSVLERGLDAAERAVVRLGG